MNESILGPFGLHIKQLRLNEGLSQEELAAKCGLDRTYISGIERGLRNVSIVNIFHIADALSLPPAKLLEFEWESDDE